MGELVRRLEYERRSKATSLMSGGQRNVNKEHSSVVRSANAMEDRKRQLYVQKNASHVKMFIDRHEYEKKIVKQLKDDLDVKSQDFNEDKFQEVRRAQSANARLQTGKYSRRSKRKSQKVFQLLPEKFYTETEKEKEKEKSNLVKFLDDCNRTFKNSENSIADVEKKLTSNEKMPKSVNIESTITSSRSTPSGEKAQQILRRRRISYAGPPSNAFDTRYLAFHGLTRRQSTPGAISMTAYVPRDVKSAPPKPRASLVPASSNESLNSDIGHTMTRSFRLIKEAFKKIKVEKTDPKQEMFNSIKADHERYATTLKKDIVERFEYILSTGVFCEIKEAKTIKTL